MTAALYPNVFETYEEKREYLAGWAAEHYIAEFGLKPCRLLEACCGEGFWADVFADAGFEVSGFDIEPVYVEAGRRKYPRVEFAITDAAEPLPYEPASFDVVFARGMPCLYAYRLATGKKVLGNLLTLVADDGLLLVGIYTDGSGEKREGLHGGGFWHHRDDVLLDLAAEVGTVTHSAKKGNYLQIGIKPPLDRYQTTPRSVSKT